MTASTAQHHIRVELTPVFHVVRHVQRQLRRLSMEIAVKHAPPGAPPSADRRSPSGLPLFPFGPESV